MSWLQFYISVQDKLNEYKKGSTELKFSQQLKFEVLHFLVLALDGRGLYAGHTIFYLLNVFALGTR
jgi:hypothetical protein